MNTPVFNVFNPTTVIGDTALVALNSEASWQLCEHLSKTVNDNDPPFLRSLVKRLRSHWRGKREMENRRHDNEHYDDDRRGDDDRYDDDRDAA